MSNPIINHFGAPDWNIRPEENKNIYCYNKCPFCETVDEGGQNFTVDESSTFYHCKTCDVNGYLVDPEDGLSLVSQEVSKELLAHLPKSLTLPEVFAEQLVAIIKTSPLEFDYLIKPLLPAAGGDIKKTDLRRLQRGVELSLLRSACQSAIDSHFIVRRHSKTIGTDGPVYWYNQNEHGGGYYVRMSGDDYRKLYNEIRSESGLVDYTSKQISDAFEEMELTAVEFKLNAEAINIENGVIEYNKSSDVPVLRPAKPSDLFSYQLSVSWPTLETGPDYKNYEKQARYSLGVFATWLGHEDDQLTEFWKALYYIFSLEQSDQVAFFCIGNGSNGKSTLTNFLHELVGHKQTTSVRLDQLERTSHITNELVDSVLNVSEELSSSGSIKESIFKAVTGGSWIHADPKGEKGFSFKPIARWVIMSNELPKTGDTSTGYIRRIKAFKFHQIKGRKDPKTLDKLLEQKELIFRIAMTEGRRLYRADGFRRTKTEIAIHDQIACHTAAGDHLIENISGYLDQIIKPDRFSNDEIKAAFHIDAKKPIFIINAAAIWKDLPAETKKRQTKATFSKKFGDGLAHSIERYTGRDVVARVVRASRSAYLLPGGYTNDRIYNAVVIDLSDIVEDRKAAIEFLENFRHRFDRGIMANVPEELGEDTGDGFNF